MDFNNHFRAVHREKKIECDQCGLKFNMKRNLFAHFFNNHRPDLKPFKCDFPGCDKSYSREFELRLHKASIHTADADKKFECKTCGKKYGVLSNLRLHEAVHVPMHLR
jgi:uncharacterized Zn-finger protein